MQVRPVYKQHGIKQASQQRGRSGAKYLHGKTTGQPCYRFLNSVVIAQAGKLF